MLSQARPQLSVVIPTLNEAEHLPGLLDDLRKQQDIAIEIIIGDGGSEDATRSVAEVYGARFVSCGRGRGTQMNAAAALASHEMFLFLHADTRLDDPALLGNAVRAMTNGQRRYDRVAGHFPLRFIRAATHNVMAYRYTEEKTAFNRENTTNGDQGLLLTKGFFTSIGGFDERMPFLEDQRIAEKIRSEGSWITLPGHVSTSARRFEAEGFHRRYILMSMMMGLHSIGVGDFFVRAPGVYQTQQDTGRLLLSPFFTLVWHMILKEWGLFGTARIFYSLGRYIRRNSWQMFYFADIWLRPLLGCGRYPCLKFHDRVFAPCTAFKVLDVVTGVLSFVWFMGVLSPYFWLVDRCKLKNKG